MSGPWTAYQGAPEPPPWLAYQTPAAQPGLGANVMDAIKGGVAGLYKTGTDLADKMTQIAAPATRSFQDAANFGTALTNVITGRHDQPMQIPTLSGALNQFAPKPQTVVGRVAERVSPYLLAAAVPGSLPSRFANAAVPAVTSELAGAAADRLGAPAPIVQGARAAGGLIGGALASLRYGPDPNAPAPQPPPDAAVQQTAQSLPIPVPMSAGQMSADPAIQLQENLALRGAKGQDAAAVARQFMDDQQQALRDNTGAIALNLGGGVMPERGGSGEAVSTALNQQFNTQRAAVNSAYEAARASQGDAVLHPQGSAQLLSNLDDALSTYDPQRIPAVTRQVDSLKSVLQPGIPDLPPGINPARVQGAGPQPGSLRDLFDARARLSTLRASSDPVEAGAAGSAVKAFDGSINDALSNDLFSGDPQAVDAWKTAIGTRRQFGQIFQGNDLIQKLTERDPRSGEVQLRVDPNDATNYILGRSGIGFVGRQNLYRDMGRLRDILGPDSDAWNSLRAETFQRFADQGDGGYEGGSRLFSGVKFAKAWDTAKKADSDLLDTLYSPEERQTIDNFAQTAARVTNPVRGGDNPSNTAVTAKALSALKHIPGVGHIASGIESQMNIRAVRAATYGATPRPAPPPPNALNFRGGLIGAARGIYPLSQFPPTTGPIPQ